MSVVCWRRDGPGHYERPSGDLFVGQDFIPPLCWFYSGTFVVCCPHTVIPVPLQLVVFVLASHTVVAFPPCHTPHSTHLHPLHSCDCFTTHTHTLHLQLATIAVVPCACILFPAVDLPGSRYLWPSTITLPFICLFNLPLVLILFQPFLPHLPVLFGLVTTPVWTHLLPTPHFTIVKFQLDCPHPFTVSCCGVAW